jgi:hypothetical protein
VVTVDMLVGHGALRLDRNRLRDAMMASGLPMLHSPGKVARLGRIGDIALRPVRGQPREQIVTITLGQGPIIGPRRMRHAFQSGAANHGGIAPAFHLLADHAGVLDHRLVGIEREGPDPTAVMTFDAVSPA